MLKSPSNGDRYSVKTDIPSGYEWQHTSTGSLLLTNVVYGKTIATMNAPWAIDFDAVYPIAADPE
ncbi:hypothetical protein [Arcanobacterium phocae]|uniref:hypothetical protein n=1 Tax=Arcanobacterium phocae TaxID=131112 RepID=UPI001C0EB2EE|nr:hypothetical protein [Arcanobacterium phocae]